MFFLGCNVNDNVNVNDLRSSFANNVIDNVNDNNNVIDNVIDNVNDNDNDNANDNINDNVNVKDNNDVNDNINNNVNDNDNVNVKDNDDVNDNVTDNDNDNVIYQFDEKHGETWAKPHQKGKPNNNTPTSDISVNINDDLQSWLNDDDIITEAEFKDNFRCIISGPSECGKTFSLKKLILASIYFDKLYIIGPTGDRYNGLERTNNKAIIEFIKDIKDLPSPDNLPKDLNKLMIFDDVRAKEPVINEYFCRGKHNNCNMIYLNQNLFSLDRQSVRENCNLFILFEQ